jgi:hypothetical protein
MFDDARTFPHLLNAPLTRICAQMPRIQVEKPVMTAKADWIEHACDTLID